MLGAVWRTSPEMGMRVRRCSQGRSKTLRYLHHVNRDQRPVQGRLQRPLSEEVHACTGVSRMYL
eukprot:64051-Chlamydomonas_euryale.AAC.1